MLGTVALRKQSRDRPPGHLSSSCRRRSHKDTSRRPWLTRGQMRFGGTRPSHLHQSSPGPAPFNVYAQSGAAACLKPAVSPMRASFLLLPVAQSRGMGYTCTAATALAAGMVQRELRGIHARGNPQGQRHRPPASGHGQHLRRHFTRVPQEPDRRANLRGQARRRRSSPR